MESGYSLADIAAATGNGNNRNGDGMWGDWIWIIVLFLFAGEAGAIASAETVQMARDSRVLLPEQDINEGFALNGIENGIRGIQQGICDSTYALNNTITSGFNGVDRSLCQMGYQLQDCCCQTQRAIDGVNYNLATQSCDTRNTIQNATRIYWITTTATPGLSLTS